MQVLKLSAPDVFTCSKYSCYPFMLEAEATIVRPEGIRQMENVKDTVGIFFKRYFIVLFCVYNYAS